MTSYQKLGVDLKTRITVEYVVDPRIIRELEADTHPAPWELYEKREFDNLDDAVSFFLPLYFNDTVYDPKFFVEILLDGETVQESYLELNSTTPWTISRLVDADRQKRLDTMEGIIKEQEAEIESLEYQIRIMGSRSAYA